MPPKVPSSSIPTTVIPPRDEATAHHGHVILFKTPHCGEDTSSDPYARLLGAHRFEASFIPVLEDTYDTTRLEEVIRAGSQTCDPTGEGVGMYDAVIITSKRGAEGWVRAARNVQASGCESANWSAIPLHTVGQSSIDTLTSTSASCPRTASTAADPDKSTVASTQPLDRRLIPSHTDPRARTAKSAEALLPLLLGAGDDGAAAPEDLPPGKRYLFVRGDKSLYTLQSALRGAGHTVDEVQVYHTTPAPGLAAAIRNISTLFTPAPRVPQGTQLCPESTMATRADVWLAFFSPSSAGYVVQHLDPDFRAALTDLPDESGEGRETRLRTVAIGETTSGWMRAQGFRVDAVAKTPDAVGLVGAIMGVVSDGKGQTEEAEAVEAVEVKEEEGEEGKDG